MELDADQDGSLNKHELAGALMKTQMKDSSIALKEAENILL